MKSEYLLRCSNTLKRPRVIGYLNELVKQRDPTKRRADRSCTSRVLFAKVKFLVPAEAGMTCMSEAVEPERCIFSG
jgi:hypothetical protein